MAVLYYVVSMYYRRSSVETKRLDSLMRSALYASYSGMFSCLEKESFLFDAVNTCAETLTGLSTIRAYREQVGTFFFLAHYDNC